MREAISALLVVVTSFTTFLGITPEKVTHDGSRTGTRVSYQSYCHPEQGFVIYENEKIPFTTNEGESVLWTKGDIDCYKLGLKVTPIPTPKPSQRQVKGVTQTNQDAQESGKAQAIIHDGSRTGPIVDYFELCTGKTIKIYENERVPYKRITGETVYSTQADIKCYENQINQLKASDQNKQPYVPTPPNNTSTDLKPLISCVVNYSCTGSSFTYQVSQELCSSFQQQAASFCVAYSRTTPSNNTTISSQAPSQDNTLERQHQEACQKVVAEWQTYKEQFWVGPGKNYSSSAEAVIALESQRQRYQQQMYSAGCSQTLYL
ncbi:hypothetical protein A3C59_02490 [Candidatus Daviesbacteria bacterium RIFCSPHIGHO2_02_FULL_36_13]|uniref:Uncharacterized protein n=1 Tax=Candidatus Daviesbacteria bacterium RIFCSPHIGHO2_02_FULL_36_13 TaxID=1797768 RepID=A0A1F5JMS3_9BACT|nr:MAG: hypothetical protein A3C59_02490 [Candidatus Daviesbacteria bacterium RIFCSPHIGHO2_02_FULL_36_13]OGE42182.1 MAG: hypothetical protein A3A45_00060 [Candidatus Daviesbacteria bacterium RIFCSPLOWO2_01_FULL_36_8]